MMDNSSSHEEVLRILQRCCAGAPEASTVYASQQQRIPGILKRLDALLPLFKAAWQCAALRSHSVFAVGLVFLAARLEKCPLASWFVGCLCCVLGLIGVPGGVAWLRVKTHAGFHCSEAMSHAARNTRIRQMFQAWFAGVRQCPYIRSGETCTVLPFLWNINRARSLRYRRVWLLSADGERFACDWVFPPSGHDPEKPIVILLTGLAPSKHWTQAGGFVADAAWHLSCRRGTTAVVLVARGTMGTGVIQHLFHGARISDLRDAILLTEDVMQETYGKDRKVPLVGVGFSMGAIILANYCGQYGSDTRLCGGVHFSGAYDAVHNMKFEYSAQTWQTYLAYNLKSSFVTPNIVKVARQRNVDVDHVLSRHVGSVLDFDREFVVVFNGYKSVEEYYKDLGLAAGEKWRAVAVPLLAIAAIDDPVIHVDTLRVSEFAAANDNLLFLITERGGHTGWPVGWRPWRHSFDFMNEAIDVFICSILQ